MRDAVEQVLDSRARRRSRTGLLLGLGVALALHLGAVLAFALAPEPDDPPPLEYVAVRVVPLAALGKPDAPARPARRPRPEPTPEPDPPPIEPAPTQPTPPEPTPTQPAPTEPAAVEPTPRGPVLPDPDSARRETAAPTPVPPPATSGVGAGSPDGSPRGTSPFGATRLEGIDPDFTYDYYLDRMLALIHTNWRRPTTQGEVRAALHFTVRKSGEIVDLTLEEESGFSTFDLAALRAVQNASPLPPLPASYRKGELRVTLIVR